MADKIPRQNLPEVKKIIEDKELHPFEKATRIHKIDYTMACQGGDGYTPALMTISKIEQLIKELK